MRSELSPVRGLLSLLASALLLSGCSEVAVSTVPVARVEVSPADAVVRVGGTTQLEVLVLSEAGEPLSGRDVTWSSGNEAIARVNASGRVTGVAPGTATIRAEAEGASDESTVHVTTNPAIGVAPSAVQFSAVQNGASPGDRTVTVSNAGEGSLTGLSAAVRYTAGQPGGWLNANLAGAAAPTSLVLSATNGSLPPGTYAAFVDITSGAADNSPLSLPVTLQVLAPAPAIGISAGTAAFQATQGGGPPAAQTITVTNAGAGSLTGLAAAVTYAAGGPSGWLSATLSTTTAPASLVLSATPGSLAPGTYNATVTLTAPTAQNSPQTVSVSLTVSAPQPLIAASPQAVTFSAPQGGANPATQTVQITNTGGGALTGLDISITYPGGQPAGWLTTNLQGTNAPTTLQIGAVTGSLPAGTYTATVRISSATAVNSPFLVDVTFSVGGASPAIGVSAAGVSFSAQVGTTSPAPQVLQITNAGGGTLNNLGVSVLGNGSNWLTAQLGGSTAPTSLTLTANLGSLAAGTYNATVRVTSSTASNSPVNIPVTFTVAAGAPGAPTGLTATARSDRRIDLAWTDNSNNESRFEIERAPAGQDSWTAIATLGVNQNTFADSTGLSGSTAYSYRVRACNAVACSGYTAAATATTAPVAPGTVTLSLLSALQVSITWTDQSTDETAFRVERSVDGGQSWSLVHTAAANAVSFIDTSVLSSRTYRYRVSACRGTLCSGFSPDEEITTGSGATSTPSNLSAVATSPTQVNLAWDSPGGQTHYELRRRLGGSGGWTNFNVPGETPTYVDNGVQPARSYEYQVRACVAGSCSSYSDRVIVNTPAN